MKLKIGSTYQKAVTIIEKLKEGNASIFICGKSGVGKSTLSYQYYKGAAGVRCSDRSHRSPSRCVFSSRTRTVCTSSGRVSRATQAAFVRGIR